MVKNIDDGDLTYMEEYARYKLKGRIEQEKKDPHDLSDFFGQYSTDPVQFVFSADEKVLIWKIVHHVKQVADVFGINSNLSHFLFAVPTEKEEQVPIHTDESKSLPQSRTHYFLNSLIDTANTNYSRSKAGYRYNENIRQFSTYLRMLAGPLAYRTLHKNLELALPSFSATNRYIRKTHTPVHEGELRSKYLLKYLEDRNLPMIVSLSEDATRIDGRVQYNALNNELTGFVLPLDEETGLPIPSSYKARCASEILLHFSKNIPIAQFVNVLMAQPLADAPPFCLLVYGTDMKYTSSDVLKRWNFIVEDLSTHGIRVINISSDSDPKYNSAMRIASMLGEVPNIFDYMNGSE